LCIAKLFEDHTLEANVANLYKLIMKSGPDEGTEVILDKDEMFLGRDDNNDIVIKDPEVSRRHARFVKQEDDYFFEDLGSTNGSFIHGLKIGTLTLLKPGITISIGEKVLVDYSMTVDPSATVVSLKTQVPRMSSTPVYAPPAAPVQAIPMPPPPPPVLPVNSVEPGSSKDKVKKILLIAAAVLLVFCVIPWIIMEISDSYCSLFGWFFNAVKAGSCPVF
jgi:pSer/pThr/pTyr-binding forkhead associated (FHA) protein